MIGLVTNGLTVVFWMKLPVHAKDMADFLFLLTKDCFHIRGVYFLKCDVLQYYFFTSDFLEFYHIISTCVKIL